MEQEMKAKNEEILNRWRQLGLLAGLKEGSINEWRCAKSYDDMANYLMSHDGEYNALITTIAFPIIRCLLCTGKNRLYRIIEPSWVIDAINNASVGSCVDNMAKKEASSKKEIAMRNNICKALKMFIETFHIEDMPAIEFLYKLIYEKEPVDDNIKFARILNNIIDLEAEFCSVITDDLKSHFVNKASDILKIGDGFVTDRGEKMEVVGYNDNGEIIVKNIEQ